MACPTGKLVVETKDPRINYNVVPGEEVLTCPYNFAHAVRPIRFAKHVLNCHRMHCESQAKLGKPPMFAICRHDRSHHVRKEELAFHESECPARTTVEDFNPGPVEEEEGAVGGIKVKLQKPPEVDKEVIESNFDEEDWESEPAYNQTFDPDQKITECRKSGYNVIQAHKVVGLTKSEKKQFYKTDAVVMRDFGSQAKVTALKDRLVSRRSTTCSTNSSTYSTYSSSSAATASTIVENEDAVDKK